MKILKTLSNSLLLSALMVTNISAMEMSGSINEVSDEAYYEEAPFNIFGYFLDTQGHWGMEIFELVAEGGFFTGTGDGIFSPDKIVTKAEFVTILAKIAFPDQYFAPSNGDWYEPYKDSLKDAEVLITAFDDVDMGGAVQKQDMALAIETLSTYLATGLSGEELLEEITKGESFFVRRFIEQTPSGDVVRTDCAALVFDYVYPTHKVSYGEGVLFPTYNYSRSGIYPNIPESAFPDVPMPNWEEDPFATTNQNKLAQVLSQYDFGTLIALDTELFGSTYYRYGSAVEGLNDPVGYLSANSVTARELSIASFSSESEGNELVALFQARIDSQLVNPDLSDSKLDQWRENARVFTNKDSVMLIVHPKADEIIDLIHSWTPLL